MWQGYFLYFFAGVLVGGVIVFAYFKWRNKTIQQMLYDVQQKNHELLITSIKDTFGAISIKALRSNTEDFLKFARQLFSQQTENNSQNLQNKKELFDTSVKQIEKQLRLMQEHIHKVETERVNIFGKLAEQLKLNREQTQLLSETTNSINNALSNSQQRGQWGERMAEDILRFSGLLEGVNYYKQKKVAFGKSRPDYTFLLPNNRLVNMDVKFPLDKYLIFVKTNEQKYKAEFLKDVRARIKEVTNRDYIDTANNTVDYALIFIPNEHIYSFILENDIEILDIALSQKAILCSPLTLYAILAIIRQSVENFNLQETANDILKLLNDFYKQWTLYTEKMENMGKKLKDAQTEYDILLTTRTSGLDKLFDKIEQLHQK
jgi:DNA recombination protein RmuC